MKKIVSIILLMAFFVMMLNGCGSGAAGPAASPTTAPLTSTPVPPTPTAAPPTPTPDPNVKRAIVILYPRFEEQEYGQTRQALERSGIAIVVAAPSKPVQGHRRTDVQPDTTLRDAHAADYDAVVFIGGYAVGFDDPEGIRLAQEAVAKNKVLAAICSAPGLLARAGVLQGKRATSSESTMLKNAGAINTNRAVERDGLIITANGPAASSQFGEAIAAALEESAASLAESHALTITILYDNTIYDARLRADWGFAALVEYGGHTVLFDTGGNGSILMGNIEQLGVDLQAIDAIVLSHIHDDHTKGLQSVLDTGITPTVYVPAAFPAAFKKNVQAHTDLVEVADPVEIFPGLHSTGEVGSSIVEQALVVETRAGIVVITGCAHPGIVQIVRQAKAVAGGQVALVVGGFHLLDYSSDRVEQIVADLRELEVQRVCPTHCTGDAAIAIFAAGYGDDYVQGGVGRIIYMSAGES